MKFVFLCVMKCPSRESVHIVGDDSLENTLYEDETLCMDKVYDALDWYQKAIIETREIEVHCNVLDTVYFSSLSMQL